MTVNNEGKEIRTENQREKKGYTSLSIYHNKTSDVVVFWGNI